ncbi:neuroligin-4, X-linked-like [Pocillopora verrucosa]|uniref:neuroligin-4, X-linked-like n=1 Tax=Pocillopora verrucosa TaxID=203993 RepID=UPI003340909E
MLIRLTVFCVWLPSIASVTVSTKNGDIEGFVTSYANFSFAYKHVNKFLGVPFAAPPTSQLRFKPPEPPLKWKPKVRSAKRHGNVCWQGKAYEVRLKKFVHNFTYSEDCLFLDIYTPDVKSKLPVMFYIHGGSYEFGATVTFPGDILALHGVVVVITQYRLGPFGFLTTGDSASPGNFGMLDQVAALQWVKENVENFGGDPGKVTIFGLSAGGTSVSLHLLSPMSEGLFQQAIAESGVDLSPFAIQPTSFGLRFANELAGYLDCPSSDHSEMMACIRQKEAKEIQDASDSITYNFTGYLRWAPVVDKYFLLDTPRNLRNKGKFEKAKFMITFNSEEGGTTFRNLVNGSSQSSFKGYVTQFAHSQTSREKNANLIADALEFMYTPWPDKSNKYALRGQLMDLFGDFVFYAPSHQSADVHSSVAPVYILEFAHRSKTVTKLPKWMGVVHGANRHYDFGIPLIPPFSSRYDADDKNVSLFIMALYTNFAKFGDPTPQPVSGVMWKRYNSIYRAYLRADSKPKMAASFAPRRMAFWNDYYPKLEQVKFDTKEYVASGTGENVCSTIFFLTALSFGIFRTLK